jgi:hypothetical protein
MRADLELDIWASDVLPGGVLLELIGGLRPNWSGDVVALVGDEESLRPELETWCRFTGKLLLETTIRKWVSTVRLSVRCRCLSVAGGLAALGGAAASTPIQLRSRCEGTRAGN